MLINLCQPDIGMGLVDPWVRRAVYGVHDGLWDQIINRTRTADPKLKIGGKGIWVDVERPNARRTLRFRSELHMNGFVANLYHGVSNVDYPPTIGYSLQCFMLLTFASH